MSQVRLPRRAGVTVAVAGLAMAAAVAACSTASTQDSGEGAAGSIYLDGSGGADWPGPGRTYGERHYSPLARIDTGNVERLGLVWAMDLPPGYTVTQPVAVGGKLFFTTGLGTVHAVDATSGRELWSYDPEIWKRDQAKMASAWGSRGVAWWNGAILAGTLDGRLLNIDADTGKLNWSVQTTREGDGQYVTGAPRAFDGKVIIGNGGADFGPTRGYVTAYDAATGRQLWRFFIVPGNPADGFENDAMAMAASTWHGEWWKHGGGGNAWNAMSYDPETKTVFVGTGNGSPWNYKVRSEGKGDNLFLSSILALDAETGAYKWHYQTNPGDSWDYNAAMDMAFGDLVIAGKPRKVLMTAPKNGFLYVIDRVSGELISAKPYARVTWTKGIDVSTGRPVDTNNNRYGHGRFLLAPSPVGAHSWLPMAFSPDTGLVYIPAMEMAAWLSDTFTDPQRWRRPDFHAVGGGTGMDMEEGTASLVAWDPVRQTEVWRREVPANVSGGVLATAGNLVFQGSIDNRFNAYDARSGKLLWSFDTEAPTIAPPIAYSVGGRQLITVLTGAGGSLVLKGDDYDRSPIGYREQSRRVLTFALDGSMRLPPASPYRFAPISDKSYAAQRDAARRGYALYSQTCIMCHGRDANASGGAAPDLRASPAILDRETFHAIVGEGALRQAGMPRFDDLTDAMVEDIRAYLRMRAHNSASD